MGHKFNKFNRVLGMKSVLLDTDIHIAHASVQVSGHMLQGSVVMHEASGLR